MTLGLIVGILGILLLIILHEFGHFIAAKKGGVEVEEFGVGFPPKAKTITKKNGTEYTLNWLPLGGFVKLKGEHDSDTARGSYGAASLPRKVLIMVAGVGMSLLAAWGIFTILALVGMPQVIDNQYYVESDSTVNRLDVIAAVAPNSQAEQAGLEDYDVIREIKLTDCDESDCISTITSEDELRDTTNRFEGQEVAISYEREGDQMTTTTRLLSEDEVTQSQTNYDDCVSSNENADDCEFPQGHLGVIPSVFTQRKATWSAPVVGLVNTGQFAWATLQGVGSIVGDLFRGEPQKAAEQTSGIVGVVYIFNSSGELGLVFTLLILGLVSISLAVMNILPIPALDGGRLFVTLAYKALRKPLSKETEEKIHSTGFIALMLLFVLITYIDVGRIIG